MTPEEERAAVVRWLRDQASLGKKAANQAKPGSRSEGDIVAAIVAISRAADNIESGAHLSYGEPG